MEIKSHLIYQLLDKMLVVYFKKNNNKHNVSKYNYDTRIQNEKEWNVKVKRLPDFWETEER